MQAEVIWSKAADRRGLFEVIHMQLIRNCRSLWVGEIPAPTDSQSPCYAFPLACFRSPLPSRLPRSTPRPSAAGRCAILSLKANCKTPSHRPKTRSPRDVSAPAESPALAIPAASPWQRPRSLGPRVSQTLNRTPGVPAGTNLMPRLFSNGCVSCSQPRVAASDGQTLPTHNENRVRRADPRDERRVDLRIPQNGLVTARPRTPAQHSEVGFLIRLILAPLPHVARKVM